MAAMDSADAAATVGELPALHSGVVGRGSVKVTGVFVGSVSECSACPCVSDVRRPGSDDATVSSAPRTT